MSEAPVEGEGQAPPPAQSTSEPQQQSPAPEPQQAAPETFDKEYVERLRKEAADYRTRLRAIEKDAEAQRKASMTEAERAVAEAEQRGRTTATTEFGKRLARTEFDAIAARRNPGYDSAQALEWVDLTRFVGENGEPDRDAIKQAVERLVPEPSSAPPSFDGGSRTPTAPTTDMNDVIRRAAARR